jgi:hypothetical protein
VHVPGLASAHRWALPEARHGQQSTRPAPDAVPLFPPSFEHAFYAARGCVCPPGAPRAPSLIPSTLPWTFGQGRTHASGWRYDSRTDPPDGARPDLAADAQATPQRPAGITTPMAAEMHGWAGSTRFVFKTDRVGERRRAGRRIPWVGAATPWSRAVPKFLTTDRRGRRNPSRRELPWIPLSSPTSACRSGGGHQTRSHHHVRNPQQHSFAAHLAAGSRNLPAPGVPASSNPLAPRVGRERPPGNPRPLPAGQACRSRCWRS